MWSPESELGALTRFEDLRPGLQSRTLSAGLGAFRDFNLIGVCGRGGAELDFADERRQVAEYSLFLVPHGQPASVIVPPGSRLWLLGFARSMSSMVKGTEPESLDLEMILSRLTLTPGDREAVEGQVVPLINLFAEELANPAKRSQAAACSLLRLMLIYARRTLVIEDQAEGPSDVRLLNRFRQLVEIGYRERRPLSAYCAELNISYDQLHGLCQRALGRAPLSLIHQRLLLDASTRLRETGDTVQSIAFSLGFAEASQFSHFFRRAVGVSPLKYRKLAREQNAKERTPGLADFADWP